jgi:GTP-binding protein HflX
LSSSTLINFGESQLTAIVVGVCLATDARDKIEYDLNELQSLLSTLSIQVVGRIVQRRQKLTAKSLVGWGKVDEIAELAQKTGAKLIIFDHTISGPQARNIEEVTKCQVLDRQGVILDIFAKHARTNTAKTQVEIARLEYMLPRLTGAWTHLQRQTGGVTGGRGMGEKQIEIDRRRVKERMSRLRGQLKQIAVDKATQRKARSSELKVALVGYTNSGKTTLLNALTRAQALAKDELFATLDSNVKIIDPATRPKILLSDTVGFIQNLPHGLVESFKSTLDEVLDADLLLHVVDISHERYREQMHTTDQVLSEIGAKDIPTIIIFNKGDRVEDPMLHRVLRAVYPGSIFVSAVNADDANRLRNHIYDFFIKNFKRVTLRIPHSSQSAISIVHKSCLILNTDYSQQDYIKFDIQTTPAVLAKLQDYIAMVPDGGDPR